MFSRSLTTTCLLLSLAGTASAQEPPARPIPINALLLTGHNNHNWQYTSRIHKDTLEATGRFHVDISDDPAAALADAEGLKKYQLFVLDYNDYHQAKRWGEPGGPAEKNFAAAVQSGIGVCAIHSADNAFKGWKEYEQMLGLMWREGTGHAAFHAFDVQIVDKDHPITKGLSDFRNRPDELYHKLVNSQKTTPHILMQAMDDVKDGSQQMEPMAFTLEYQKGRIFATPLGHVWTSDMKSKHTVVEPNFRTLICRGAEWAATGAVTLGTEWKDVRTHNILTGDETMSGWKLLFDGTQASADANFRGYKQDKLPAKGWIVKDNALIHTGEEGDGGGDIVTKSEFTNFEFQCQWKAAKGANSGIMYRVTEKTGQPYESGPEMQILDDEAFATQPKKNMAGAYYDMYPVSVDVARPAGEWNTARIVINGSHETFYLNGFKVVDVDSSSDDYKKVLAGSKWAKVTTFNATPTGHIDFQSHGGEVAFRNIKIREIK